MKKYQVRLIIASIFTFCLWGCKKFIEVPSPVTGLEGSVVFKTDAAAASAANNIIINVSSTSGVFSSGVNTVTLLSGLAADELTNYTPTNPLYVQFYKNNLLPDNSNTFWTLYGQIFNCNSVLEGLSASQSISASLRSQIEGESKFMRAFLYFYLVNLYGEVPLALTTDYKINNTLSRSSVTDVYKQIVQDLKDAQSLLPINYYTPTGGTSAERVLPNRAAATALLARVYLYNGDWSNAEIQATSVIGNTLYSITDITQVFKKNSAESIWQFGTLDPIPINGNTYEGLFFVLDFPPGVVQPATLNEKLYREFNNSDKRKAQWVGTYTDNSVTPSPTYHYPFKYKVGYTSQQPTTEYLTILRLSEQYLIRAEARANLGKIDEAKQDLFKIRDRAGLGPSSATEKNALISEILQERRLELFCEVGHRWFDLKRSGKIDQVMQTAALDKGAIWNSYQQLLPIPSSEIQLNPNLKQNAGY